MSSKTSTARTVKAKAGSTEHNTTSMTTGYHHQPTKSVARVSIAKALVYNNDEYVGLDDKDEFNHNTRTPQDNDYQQFYKDIMKSVTAFVLGIVLVIFLAGFAVGYTVATVVSINRQMDNIERSLESYSKDMEALRALRK